MLEEARRRRFRPAQPVDLAQTLRPARRGPQDPTLRPGPRGWWRATRTPAGPATEHLVMEPEGTLLVEAWGPGADWLLEHAPVLVGALDDSSGFRPAHPLLRELHRRHPGLRICRTEAVFEAAMAIVLEQKVQNAEAWRSWRSLAWTLGEPAPGPAGLRLPPAPELVARTPSHVFHRAGVELKRSETVRRAASRASRLEEAVAMAPQDAHRRLSALPGMGPWTAAKVALVALGDADAVPLGDYHNPHLVAWALAGEARGSDERMLELLEPYRGHRGRVLRLLMASGVGAPRRGPRLPLRDVARM